MLGSVGEHTADDFDEEVGGGILPRGAGIGLSPSPLSAPGGLACDTVAVGARCSEIPWRSPKGPARASRHLGQVWAECPLCSHFAQMCETVCFPNSVWDVARSLHVP